MEMLNVAELHEVSGGFDLEEVADGVGLFAGATLAVALAPEELLGAVAVGSYYLASAAAGALIGDGAAK